MGMREECGVMGIIGDAEAASLAYLGLFAQQHRGQEGCGIASLEMSAKMSLEPSVDVSVDTVPPRDLEAGSNADATKFHVHKSFGLVAESFNPEILARLVGNTAIGHVRYSTQGGHTIQNVQPFYFRTGLGLMAIAHNGNLTNAHAIRSSLEASGSIFQSTSDTEIFVHLIARADAPNTLGRIVEAMKKVSGAYSMVILTEDRL